MEGWIKLHRKFLEWEWFKVDEMVKLFIYLLLSANYEEKKWQGVTIKRGQLLTGINSLHENTKISHQSLRTCLSRLEKTGEINRQSTNKYTIITICNYDSYQYLEISTNNQTNKQLTNNQQTTNKQLTTTKEIKEYKEIKNNIFIPPTLIEVIEYCTKRKNNVDSAKFIDFYTAKGWMIGKNKMKDWKAAVRTWEDNNKNNSKKVSGDKLELV